jgi:hypothetical protein
MKKSKNTMYIRYEFSNESGTPEGGDVFEFSSIQDIQEMASEIIEVAQKDKVSVNLTIGGEKPFFGFLKSVGLSREHVEAEIVQADDMPPAIQDKKTTKKQKSAAKSAAKSPSKPKAKAKAKAKKAKSKKK